MSAKGFTIPWLKERFKYDNAARNQKVEQALVHHFQWNEKLSIVDIGSGTGANCLYFMERLFKNQQWTLIEQDAALCEATIDQIERFLQDYNFFYSFDKNVFRIKVWESRVKIIILNASFFEMEDLVDWDETDVVMAAALFDVLTFEQFKSVVSPIIEKEIALFTTMNYQSMRFQPSDEKAIKYIQAYEDHMVREQSTGIAMGPNSSTLMEQFFEKHSLNLVKGESLWQLEKKDKKIKQYLLGFMEEALQTYLDDPKEDFKNWLVDRKKEVEGNALSIEVSHMDYFLHKKKKA